MSVIGKVALQTGEAFSFGIISSSEVHCFGNEEDFLVLCHFVLNGALLYKRRKAVSFSIISSSKVHCFTNENGRFVLYNFVVGSALLYKRRNRISYAKMH